MKEIWKEIKDHPDYEVSNLGQVRSLKFSWTTILKPFGKPYHQVELCTNGFRERHCIHILVAEVFLGQGPKGYVCNHKDGIKLHNDADNLEWITKSEDIQHAINLNLSSPKGWCYNGKGENHSQVKLKIGEVWLIKKLLFNNITQRKIAKMFDVSRGCIAHISSGRGWSHITL